METEDNVEKMDGSKLKHGKREETKNWTRNIKNTEDMKAKHV